MKQNHPKRTEKNHQTHQTSSKKKSKHVKSIQVIHVYITVHLGFWSHPSLSIFCNSAWHSWWRHARWHAWHSWRYHTPEAMSNGALVVLIKGKFKTQPNLFRCSRATKVTLDLQQMEILQAKKNVTTYLLLASDNFTKLSPPNGMPGGRAGKPGGIPGLNNHQ